MGLYRGYIGIMWRLCIRFILGLYRDDGKENENFCIMQLL